MNEAADDRERDDAVDGAPVPPPRRDLAPQAQQPPRTPTADAVADQQ